MMAPTRIERASVGRAAASQWSPQPRSEIARTTAAGEATAVTICRRTEERDIPRLRRNFCGHLAGIAPTSDNPGMRSRAIFFGAALLWPVPAVGQPAPRRPPASVAAPAALPDDWSAFLRLFDAYA